MPDGGMQCRHMDCSAFKGVICNCLIAQQYGLMAKTLKDPLEPEAPKCCQNVIYGNKKKSEGNAFL